MKQTVRVLLLLVASVGAWAATPSGQSTAAPSAAPRSDGGVDAGMLLKPLGENWPTYSGDYSGRRYSTLTQVNQSNVKNLQLVWSTRIVPGMGSIVLMP